MAKNQNSAEKRRREVEKKFKAEEKRKNRQKKKIDGPEVSSSYLESPDEKSSAEAEPL